MELIKTDEKDVYILTYNNKEYDVSYDSDASKESCCLSCNYTFDSQQMEYGEISSLSGNDLIEDVCISIDFHKLYSQDTGFALVYLAKKNEKLMLNFSIGFFLDNWNYEIELEEYIYLLKHKLTKDINISYSKVIIEDGLSYISFIVEYELNSIIDECIMEMKLLVLKLHYEILDMDYKENKTISRYIEFEPEYYQAGLGILNYFGTVVREKYPQGNAKVKIEQNGYSVTMTIETENGDKETIEKLLQNYELVVIGEKPPESLFDSQLQILDLKSELRLAHARLEDKREQLAYQNKEHQDLKSIFEHMLTQNNSHVINMEVSPKINIDMKQTTQISIANDISDISSFLEKIIAEGDDNIISKYLTDVNNEVDNLSRIEDKTKMKESSSLSKIKTLVEDANKMGSSLNTFLNNVSNGFETMQKIGKKYNSIAEWCGAPQIPSLLLK